MSATAIAATFEGAGASVAPRASGLVIIRNKGEMSKGELIELPADNALVRLRAMSIGVLEAAALISSDLQAASVRYRAAFVTLTYRDDAQWEPRDVHDLLSHYRKWAKRRGVWVRYVWTLETTKRDRPHYHIVFFLPRGVTPPLPDKQGWWRKGCTNAKWARSAVGYIAKYASKGSGSGIPKGARLWGCSSLSSENRARLRWCLVPGWLRRLVPYDEGVKRLGSWWVNAATGWAYLSPWVVDCVRAGVVVLRYVGWSLSSVFIPSCLGEYPPDPDVWRLQNASVN